MKIFTKKIFLAVTLLGAYLLGFIGEAHSKTLTQCTVAAGEGQTYKGGDGTVWVLNPEQHSKLMLSAQNAQPHLFMKVEERGNSRIYAAAVSQVFRSVELKADKSMYTAVSLLALAPGRNDLIKQVPSINAYPNPSRGVTLFSLNQTANDTYKIRISNTIGRVVTSAEVAPVNATTVVQLDMSSLPSGVYFYSLLVNDKTVETKRLILQK
ncbi:T9SS type A sorting domain-containing protein [Pontibacter chitinilyticus]|uniref:T9SS type A sorting domain-containing protein n=1 Tax=Pontibacter chitinilyticus TaxID=2674989 RepID=UPI00321C3BBC